MDWELELVVVPVTDVDRAKHFYGEQLGFVVDHDTRVGDEMRVVQLTPPGWVEQGVEVSRIQHYEGSDRVDGRGGRWSSFVFFGDPTGTTGRSRSAPPSSL
jgi:catechol 2,3-dioxygenase-like lactoylglutathione lyase family enzyme